MTKGINGGSSVPVQLCQVTDPWSNPDSPLPRRILVGRRRLMKHSVLHEAERSNTEHSELTLNVELESVGRRLHRQKEKTV